MALGSIDADLVFFERGDRQENGPLAQEWNELLKHGHLRLGVNGWNAEDG
jgi:hypothetical protein